MKTITTEICHHCHSPIRMEKVIYTDHTFCCHGCKNVFQLLSDNGLCDYYLLDENAGLQIDGRIDSTKFAYLDQPKYRSKFIRFSDEKSSHVLLSVPQMHCRSCLWLLEKLYRLDAHILSSQVYFEKKEVYIIFDESQLSFSSLVALLSKIGYEPSLNFDIESTEKISAQRNTILKIGISGFCFANIMMLSLPEYFASELIREVWFRRAIPILNLTLSLPILYVAYTDFIRSAWLGLKKRILNIDLPVSLAVIVTFLRSIYEIKFGLSNGYLDSMSGIVFFMLIGRWLQHRTENYLSFSRDFMSYFPIAVERIVEGKSNQVPIQELEVQDKIRIYHNEIIPVDSILSKGEAMIDYSFVNGENTPVLVEKGSHIYAGGRQLHGIVELIVMHPYNQSHLTSLWNHHAFKKDKLELKEQWTDKLGMYFTYAVLILSGFSGIYWYLLGETALMWNAISTTLIVACPCALLLASGFTYGQMLRILGKNNFYVRHYTVLDRIRQIKHVIFDKTGTITHAHQQKIHYEGDTLHANDLNDIVSLLSQSKHPHAMSISQYLGGRISIESIPFKETIGKGMEAWIENRYIKIGSDEFCGISEAANQTHVNVCIDNKWRGRFVIKNAYRSGISRLLKIIQNRFRMTILSGDIDGEYATLRKIIRNDHKILFHQSPMQKLEYVLNKENQGEHILMVGDGLNDAGAFQASTVAVALTEKNNFFNPASDIILDSEKLAYLDKFIDFIRTTKPIIYCMFVYSILYNVIGLSFALRGALTPVVAAILMPISSISLILFIHLATRFSEKKYLSFISKTL